MVSEGNTLFDWGTKPMPRLTSWSARTFVMSWSASVTRPSRTRTRPNIAFSRVDLPAPFGPMMPDELAGLGVQVGAVEDVDAGHVAGDEVVRDDEGVLGAVDVRIAVADLSGAQGPRLIALHGVEVERLLALVRGDVLGQVAGKLIAHCSASSVKDTPDVVRALSWWPPR